MLAAGETLERRLSKQPNERSSPLVGITPSACDLPLIMSGLSELHNEIALHRGNSGELRLSPAPLVGQPLLSHRQIDFVVFGETLAKSVYAVRPNEHPRFLDF